MLTGVIINLVEWEDTWCPRGVRLFVLWAWYRVWLLDRGSCFFGSSTATVLQNDIWGRDLSPTASQSHQVLQSGQINGAESWLCRAVHHVWLTACCSPCLSTIHHPVSFPSMEESRNWHRRPQQEGLWFTPRLMQYDVVEQFVIYLWIKYRFGETSPLSWVYSLVKPYSLLLAFAHTYTIFHINELLWDTVCRTKMVKIFQKICKKS